MVTSLLFFRRVCVVLFCFVFLGRLVWFSSEAIWAWSFLCWCFSTVSFFKNTAMFTLFILMWALVVLFFFFWWIWFFLQNCWMYGHKFVIHYFSSNVCSMCNDHVPDTGKLCLVPFFLSWYRFINLLIFFFKSTFDFISFLFLTSLISVSVERFVS